MQTAHEHESFNDLLTQWMKNYGPRILRTIRSRGVPPDDAEDVMQDVLVKAYRRLLNRPPLPKHPEGWLKRIAIHAAVDYLRKRAAEARRMERLVESGKVRSSYCPYTDVEKEVILRKLLALLDGNDPFDYSLRVVEKYLFDGWTVAQIAAQYDVADVTASRWYKRGLQRLRQVLEERGITSLPEQS